MFPADFVTVVLGRVLVTFLGSAIDLAMTEGFVRLVQFLVFARLFFWIVIPKPPRN